MSNTTTLTFRSLEGASYNVSGFLCGVDTSGTMNFCPIPNSGYGGEVTPTQEQVFVVDVPIETLTGAEMIFAVTEGVGQSSTGKLKIVGSIEAGSSYLLIKNTDQTVPSTPGSLEQQGDVTITG